MVQTKIISYVGYSTYFVPDKPLVKLHTILTTSHAFPKKPLFWKPFHSSLLHLYSSWTHSRASTEILQRTPISWQYQHFFKCSALASSKLSTSMCSYLGISSAFHELTQRLLCNISVRSATCVKWNVTDPHFFPLFLARLFMFDAFHTGYKIR